jgi:hypothetical protein
MNPHTACGWCVQGVFAFSSEEDQMAKLAWTPWHKVVKIRPDLKSGELSLNVFAADLYDVAMGKAKQSIRMRANSSRSRIRPSIFANWRKMSCCGLQEGATKRSASSN